MSKHSKWTIGCIVAAALYLGGTWSASRLAHARVQELAERMAAQSNGLLRISESASTPGFFSSIEDVTFALDGPAAQASALLTGGEPFTFTVHNVIQHGPLPGLRSVGMARIQSSIVMKDELRERLNAALGAEQPFAVVVTLGWFGSAQIGITSPALSAQLPNGGGALEWQGLTARADIAPHFKNFSITATAPGLKLTRTDSANMSFSGLSFTGDFTPRFEELYVGDGELKIESLDAQPTAATGDQVHVEDAAYRFQATAADEYYDVAAQMGVGLFRSSFPLQNVRLDFAFKHLHGPTLAALNRTVRQATGARNAANAADADAAMANINAIQDAAMELLRHSPEFALNQFGFGAERGDLKITAHARFEQLTEQDIQAGFESALKKLALDADFDAARPLLDHWPQQATAPAIKSQAAQFEQQGYLTREGERLKAHIELRHGVLSVNGKKLGGG